MSILQRMWSKCPEKKKKNWTVFITTARKEEEEERHATLVSGRISSCANSCMFTIRCIADMWTEDTVHEFLNFFLKKEEEEEGG